jgi:hypothetical protein
VTDSQISSVAESPQTTETRTYTQYVVVTRLKKRWPDLNEGQRTAEIAATVPLIDRLSGMSAADAQTILRSVVTLPDEEILAALTWVKPHYEVAEEERIYDALGGFLGRYLEWSRQGNAPLGYHVWSGITALGALCQRRIFVSVGRSIYMNFYTILGGHKSTGKGQASDAAEEFLRKVNTRFEGDPDEKSKKINLLPPDTTQEALVSTLARLLDQRTRDKNMPDGSKITIMDEAKIDATGYLSLDELATFLGKDVWNASRRTPFLVQIKESNRYEKVTKKSGLESLQNVAVSMLAGCAPDWLHSTVDSDMLGGGFMDRTVWVYREPHWERRRSESVVTSVPKDPVELSLLADWGARCISSLEVKEPAIVPQATKNALHNFYLEMLDKEHASYLRYGADSREKSANRILWIAAQLSTLIALGGTDEIFPPVIVKPDHVDLARAIILLEEQSMKKFIEEGTRSKSVYWDNRVLDYLTDMGGCASRGSMNQEFRRQFGSTDEVARVVKNLLDQDLVFHETHGTSVIYWLADHERCPRCNVGRKYGN